MARAIRKYLLWQSHRYTRAQGYRLGAGRDRQSSNAPIQATEPIRCSVLHSRRSLVLYDPVWSIAETPNKMKGITMRQFTRRQTLKNVTAMTAVTFLGTLGVPRRAAAGTEITAVEWGGDVVNAMKQIEAKQDKVKVNWVL